MMNKLKLRLIFPVLNVIAAAYCIEQKKYSVAYVLTMITVFELLRFIDEKNK